MSTSLKIIIGTCSGIVAGHAIVLGLFYWVGRRREREKRTRSLIGL